MTSIFSYVVTHDYGFAPNPYNGVLTLATCKPNIRKVAREKDWVIGTGSVVGVGNGRVVFAAQVSRVIPLDVYGSSPAYIPKRPTTKGEASLSRGDNIYFLDDLGNWKQRRNLFHGPDMKAHDLSGKHALWCERFWYFGDKAPALPARLEPLLKKGPNHKRTDDPDSIGRLEVWLSGFAQGMLGQPFSLKSQKG